MLYDNALLARAYVLGHLVTGEADLRGVAEETLDYLTADMRTHEGGFCSARDADSEGEEGTFYLWTPEEVEDALEADDAALFSRLYDVTPGGNFEGRSILHLPHPPEAIAHAEGLSMAELSQRVAVARERLLEARSHREAPFRDDKVLVSWNAMAIRTFAEAGAALSRWDYVDTAREGAEFVWELLRPEGRLLHTYLGGQAKIPAFLDDHAGLGNALLSLHGATLEPKWLDAARWCCEEILDRFWDEQARTVFDTAADAERLVLRPRDAMDNATPSGPSLAAELLSRAGHVFDDNRFREAAVRIIDHERETLARYGPAFGRMLSVFDRIEAEPIEIAIAGKSDDDATRSLVEAAHATFIRDLTIVGSLDGNAPHEVPLLKDRPFVDGLPAAYVCREYTCKLPVTAAEAVRGELGG